MPSLPAAIPLILKLLLKVYRKRFLDIRRKITTISPFLPFVREIASPCIASEPLWGYNADGLMLLIDDKQQ